MSRLIAPGVRLYTRADWGAAPASGAMTRQSAPPREGFVHYDSTPNAEQVTNLAAQKAAMRGIQSYHQHTNGWSDGGYHYVVFQPYGKLKVARVFELRPVAFVPAAQLGHNTGTLAVQVYAGPGDPLKAATVRAIAALLGEHDSVRTLGGHRDVVSTSCPGDVIYRRIPDIAKAAGLRVFTR